MQKGESSRNFINRAQELSRTIVGEQSKEAVGGEFEEFVNQTRTHSLHSGLENAPVLLDFEPPSNTVKDGAEVLEYFNSPNYTSDLYGQFQIRISNHLPDHDFNDPQVTRASLVKDGQDIVEYLKLNRYAIDTNSIEHEFDVNSLILDFEEQKDGELDKLSIAVQRLKMYQSHLGIK